MILDTLQNRNQYTVSSLPLLGKAFEWLLTQDFDFVDDGKHLIQGDDVFALVSTYTTKDEAKWEAHRSYADLQYVVSGSELFGYAPLAQLDEVQAYSESDDYALFEGNGEFVNFQAGMFAILLPSDAHMPGIAMEEPEQVRKVVIKIRIQPALELLMATGNSHKIAEAAAVLGNNFLISSAQSKGFTKELTENGDTLEANAMQKAEQVFAEIGMACIADDTGLFVEALNGEPGVFSARFAGPQCIDADNRKLLMDKLNGAANRNACFRTVIAYKSKNIAFTVSGEICGTIADSEKGTHGFGYDSLFIPEGYSQTFAELHPAEKNRISHRAKALTTLCRELHERGIKP
jgi:XTP/dITP diphosphohydrolase